MSYMLGILGSSSFSLSFLSQSPHVPPQKLRIATNLAVVSLCYETTSRFVDEGFGNPSFSICLASNLELFLFYLSY